MTPESALWRSIAYLLASNTPDVSGWVAFRKKEGQRLLELKGRKAIRVEWQVPTLLLDATLNVEQLKPFWPAVKQVADIAVEAPYMNVHQVVDYSFSKASMKPERLVELNTTLTKLARRYGGAVLIVMQKAVEEAIGDLPPNVTTAHHNAVSGRDEWRDVEALVVVGRTAPTPRSVERIAEALTGVVTLPKPYKQRAGAYWYPRVVTQLEAPGAVYGVADRHHDPVVEGIRWQICEGELLQIIGRARGVNRTETDAVDVWVLTDCPVDLPVTSIRADELDPTIYDEMLLSGGIAFENAADAVKSYPSIWKSAAHLRKAKGRQSVTFPIEEYSIGNVTLWSYQKAGERQKVYLALVAGSVADPAAAIASTLGPLVACRRGA